MKELIMTIALTLGLCMTANAEVWKWVDADGNVHYGDRPQHASSQGIKLAHHTSGSRSAKSSGQGRASSSQSAASAAEGAASESAEGRKAQEYYCNQASEIYASYSKAPRLYRTNADGQREYLSDREAARLLAESKAKVTEWCT
mgnify:FL=1